MPYFGDSPAIDAAVLSLLVTDPTTDQRGFPRVSNGRAVRSAFEFSAPKA
nr:choice-of-anchor Q domain-containing protein [Iningainema tapete]